MIIDLKNLSPSEREDFLREAGAVLRHVPFPNLHPDRPSSMHFYEIVIPEDVLQAARRRRYEAQLAGVIQERSVKCPVPSLLPR